MKEKNFIKGVIKNQADSYDKYEDVIDEKIKKEIKDQSPSIDELIDAEHSEIEEDNYIEEEHIGPEAYKYKEKSPEQIYMEIHEQLSAQYPEQYPEHIVSDVEGLRESIWKAYEQNDAEVLPQKESMQQHYIDERWKNATLQSRDIKMYGNHSINKKRSPELGRDNLKTLTPNKKECGIRGFLRKVFKIQPELITEEDRPSWNDLMEEKEEDGKNLSKGVLSKEELNKEEVYNEIEG